MSIDNIPKEFYELFQKTNPLAIFEMELSKNNNMVTADSKINENVSQKEKGKTYTIGKIKEAFLCHNEANYVMPQLERQIRQSAWKSFKKYLEAKK